MAFVDRQNDPTLGKETCPDDWRVWVNCPNLKRMKDDHTLDGEWYKCEKCGRTEYADYEEMR